MLLLGLYLVPSSLACHVFFMLCSIFFKKLYLMFELHFLIHLAPLMHLILVHIFFSFPPSFWFICLFMKKMGRVYRSVYRSVSSFLYDSCVHSQEEKFYLVHICWYRILSAFNLHSEPRKIQKYHFLPMGPREHPKQRGSTHSGTEAPKVSF